MFILGMTHYFECRYNCTFCSKDLQAAPILFQIYCSFCYGAKYGRWMHVCDLVTSKQEIICLDFLKESEQQQQSSSSLRPLIKLNLVLRQQKVPLKERLKSHLHSITYNIYRNEHINETLCSFIMSCLNRTANLISLNDLQKR